jgi:hypothetical protein
MTPVTPRPRNEAVGIGVSGIATLVAVGAIIAGASVVAMLATMVGLAALWPSIHESGRR